MRSKILLGLLGILIVSSGTVRADIIVAENVISPVGFGAAIFSDITRAQTFQATGSGNLSTVDLQVWVNPTSPTADLIVDFVGLTGAGAPDESNVLASRSVSPASFTTAAFTTAFTSIDFSSSLIPLVLGESYGILLRSQTAANPFWYSWATANPSNYADGQIFFRQNSVGGALTPIDQDAGFRVSVSAVPEPSSILLILICAAGFVFNRKRYAIQS